MSSKNSTSTVAQQTLGRFVQSLAAKQPTPGGGGAAAVGAALGAAAASMAAAYTQRKKDKESGAADRAMALLKVFGTANTNLEEDNTTNSLLRVADDDAVAYTDLQRTWKKKATTEEELSFDEKASIEARALAVPTNLVKKCHSHIIAIQDFLPHCNDNITSDAKVGIHLLAGAARSAYQTVLVNQPSIEEKEQLKLLMKDIRTIEDDILDINTVDEQLGVEK
mmetsp:Transcript_37288/g.42593  ORF Transcript_37288/g.42593 Transcript_37288/m.42593 type:complete len:223 (-) Transcript_37288:57-725(-)